MPKKDFKIPNSLTKALKNGEVVPFVGAGASMTVRKMNADGSESDESLFPSWNGFIKILLNTLRDEHKNDDADYIQLGIKTKKLNNLDALQSIQESLGESLWYQAFDECFDVSSKEAFPGSLKLNRLIWRLARNLIITTNVENVFKWTCPEPDDFTALDVQKVEYAQLQKDDSPKKPTVWYLHGQIGHKEKVVFTRDQFEAFYKKRGNEAKLQTLLGYLTRKTLLFIGFSLDDDYLRELLEYIHDIYKGGADSYYILFREPDIEKANLPSYVTPVPFEDFGEPLEELVEELARIANGDDDGSDGDPGGGDPKPPPKSDPPDKTPFFNVQYKSKGPEFVGRIGKLDEIWNLLTRDGCASIGQAVNVKGLGGIGKTQLAVEYAHEYRQKYPNGVYWIVADQTIDTQLIQIADRQGWINQYDKSINQLDFAKKRFLALTDCLILFDNVDAWADIENYLPPTDPQTHILITSREKITGFRQIDLDLLERSESRELLLKISGKKVETEDEAKQLTAVLEILGDIPLAVELVGGYLAEHPTVTFAKYRRFLEETPLDKLEREFPDGSFTNHDRSIIRTLRISEKTISEKPLMAEILKVLAWSGSSSMGVSLLKALVEIENDFEFETAIGEACNLNLLKKEEETERYTIHRLIAKVIRHENELDDQKEWLTKIIARVEHWFDERKNNYIYLSEFEAETEHLKEWQNNGMRILPSQSVWLLALENYPFWHRGNYKESLDILKQAYNVFIHNNLQNEKLFADILNDLGIINRDFGDFRISLEYQEKSLELRNKLFGERHPDTAMSFDNVGTTYGELGDHRKALEYQEKALELRKELFGEKYSDTASSYNNIGTTYMECGNYQKALEYLEKALELRKELFGEWHPDTAISYNNVGSTYGNLGNHQKALEYQKKALELHKKLLGDKHPQITTFYNNVGMTYGYLGDHRKALEYQEKALELQKKLFGEIHPDIASSYNNIGTTYGKLGDHQKALKYQNTALRIRKKIFSKNHRLIASSYNNVGTSYGESGDHRKALEYQVKALELRKELFGERHPDTAISYDNVGATYGNLGDHQKALEYQKKALKLRRDLFGDKHPDIAMSLNNVGHTYRELGDYNKALKYQEKALELQREIFGEIHPLTAISYNNVGAIYRESGEHLSALEYLIKALEIQRKLFGINHPDTAMYYNNVGSTYGVLGDHQKALEYLAMALDTYQELLGKGHPNTIILVGNLIFILLQLKEMKKAGLKAKEFVDFMPPDHPQREMFELLAILGGAE